ncbi:MAG: hypothetical protein CMH41_04740 [Micrococcales bacterium]|nr:hypothetical protein [Micrococcales bacterium]
MGRISTVTLGLGAVLGFSLLSAPTGQGTDAESAVAEQAVVSSSTGAGGVLAKATARAAEGNPGSVIEGVRRARLGGSATSSRLKRKAKRALRKSPIVRGKRPRQSMPREPYIPQNACNANELPGVVAFREMLLDTYKRPADTVKTYNISRGCDTPGVSEHEEGRALDFEADVKKPAQVAQARQLLRYLTKRGGFHARRWGIMYIIWDRKVWAQYKPYWRNLSNRGNRIANHEDHIHFSFTWNGAVKKSSYWTGIPRRADRGPCVKYRWHFAPVELDRRIKKPRRGGCRSPRAVGNNWSYGKSVMYWQSGDRVKWLQQFLSEEGFYGGGADGAFGRMTYGAVQAWQRANRVPRTGVWDPVSQHTSRRTVGKRSGTSVTGWPSGAVQVVSGQRIEIPVTVTTDGKRGRQVSLMRRPMDSDGAWETVSAAVTAATGSYSAVIVPTSGGFAYRLLVDSSSRFSEKKTPVYRVTGVEPAPLPPAPVPEPSPMQPTSPPVPPEIPTPTDIATPTASPTETL